MKHLFVDYERSKLLRDAGFDLPCIARYVDKRFQMNVLAEWYNFNGGAIKGGWVSAPLLQQALEWAITRGIKVNYCQHNSRVDNKPNYSYAIFLYDVRHVHCEGSAIKTYSELVHEIIDHVIKILKP